jgi:hypothetical protein
MCEFVSKLEEIIPDNFVDIDWKYIAGLFDQ